LFVLASKVPPASIVKLLMDSFAVIITVWPLSILAFSVGRGTVPVSQVAASFQLPEVTLLLITIYFVISVSKAGAAAHPAF